MKRNDMVIALAKELYELGILETYEQENYDNADAILEFLDSKGMLPPSINKDILRGDALYTEEVNEWEKE